MAGSEVQKWAPNLDLVPGSVVSWNGKVWAVEDVEENGNYINTIIGTERQGLRIFLVRAIKEDDQSNG